MLSKTNSIMDRLQMFERGFLILGAIGFTLLWPVMLFNGTLIALLQAAWTGNFRNGQPLLAKYTRFPPFDFMISVLVAFFDEQINGTDGGAWYLMLDLVVTLQVASLWVLVEASRTGQKKRLLELFFIWPLLWNLFGTAAVLPVYLYLHTKYAQLGEFDSTISTARSKNLIIVSVLGVTIPAICLLSAYGLATDFSRHAVIAGFEFSPLLLGALVTLVSSAESKTTHIHRTSRDHIQCLYVLTGLVSGAVHLYTLAVTLLSRDGSVKFGRVFIPSPSGVIPRSIDNIHDGALLFLQYDWIVVNITCAMWVYLLMGSYQILVNVKGKATKGFLIFASTLIIGPGATVSCALYLRESDLFVRYKQIYRN